MQSLKQNILEMGVEPSETSINFQEQEELTVEQLNELQDLRHQQIEKEFQKLLEMSQETEEVPNLKKQHISNYENQPKPDLQPLKQHNIPVNPENTNLTYSNHEQPHRLNPYRIEIETQDQFLEFAKQELNEKHQDRLKIAEEVLEAMPDKINIPVFEIWYDKEEEIPQDFFNEEAILDEQQINLDNTTKPIEQTVDEYWEKIKNDDDVASFNAIKRMSILDLNKALQGQAINRGKQFRDKLNGFEKFFTRYKPQNYNHVRGNMPEYTVMPITEQEKLEEAAQAVGSCLKNKDITEAHMMHNRDPFTFVQGIFKDQMLEGYNRSFVMQDSNGEYFLGIDTIEVPKNGGVYLEDVREDFEEREDILQAGALGAITLAEDLGLDYVAARDARIRFGLRQGYNNTQQSIEYEKLGDTVPYYSVAEIPYDLEEDKPLPEDMKPEKEEDKLEKARYPGFSVYHKPGEQEVRGFQTEPGTHKNSAYILFENPDNF